MRPRILAVVLAVALVVAACGDDDVGQTTTTTTTTTTTATETTPPTDDGDFTGLPSAQCLDIFMAMAEAASVTFGGDVSDLDAFVQTWQSMAAAVPAEIRADFQVIADAFTAFATAMADAGIDLSDPNALESAEALAAYFAALEAFDTEAFERASDNIDAYLTAACE